MQAPKSEKGSNLEIVIQHSGVGPVGPESRGSHAKRGSRSGLGCLCQCQIFCSAKEEGGGESPGRPSTLSAFRTCTRLENFRKERWTNTVRTRPDQAPQVSGCLPSLRGLERADSGTLVGSQISNVRQVRKQSTFKGTMTGLQVMDVGLAGTDHEKTTAHQLATLPMRFGGLRLRLASRMAPAAFWSSWADALEMVHQRLPEVAHTTVESLDGPREAGRCLGELCAVTTALDQQGFIGRQVGPS